MIITPEMIDNATEHGACAEALLWLRAEPHHWENMQDEWRMWAVWRCTHPALLAHAIRYDKDAGVRREAATNPNAPADAIAYAIRHDAVVSVRWRVAINPSTPPEALSYAIRHDADTGVRRRVAINPATPPEALAHAAEHDTDEDVRRVATDNLAKRKRIV